ncbi:MAG: homogentisate 1,2-dioxygenase [Parcubacteria group bacterium]|nr:homogentisate 1,2-dioxygenase [Parcubacteria group bacterium]
MDGSPQGELHTAKMMGFEVEMLLSKPPTVIKNIRRARDAASRTVFEHDEESDLVPRAFRVRDVESDYFPQPLISTDDGTAVVTLVLVENMNSHSIRNIDADCLWYVYEGCGHCDTDFGKLSYKTGDFVYIPRHALSCFDAKTYTRMIGIETASGLRLPMRRPYDNTDIPFNESAMRIPEPYPPEGGPDYRVEYVKRNGKWSYLEYAYTPFLCVAWKGAPYPFAIHSSKLNFSYVQSIHPDPSNFALLASPDASVVVSVLGPRFVHSLPYHHLNNMEEFLFYAKEYDARKGSAGGVGDSGTATLHPQGIWHGPQMAAFEAWKRPASPKEIPWVDDLAIMFETRKPLHVCEDARKILVPGYERSWLDGWEEYQARKA